MYICRESGKNYDFHSGYRKFQYLCGGIYEPSGALTLSFKLSCDQNKSSDEYAVTIKNILDINAFDSGRVHHAVIASVVPPLTFVISTAAAEVVWRHYAGHCQPRY